MARNSMLVVLLNDSPTSLMSPVVSLTSNEKTALRGWVWPGAKAERGTECS